MAEKRKATGGRRKCDSRKRSKTPQTPQPPPRDTFALHTVLGNHVEHEEIERLLLADPDAAARHDSSGEYPLHIALKTDAPEATVLLLVQSYPEAAAIRDSFDEYPLHSAHFRGSFSEKIVLALLEANTDIAKEPFDDRTTSGYALHLAMSRKASPTSIERIFKAYPDAAKKLFSNDQQKDSLALHEAIRQEYTIEMIKLLLEHYPDAVMRDDTHDVDNNDDDDYNSYGNNVYGYEAGYPICIAIENKAFEIIRLLLSTKRHNWKKLPDLICFAIECQGKSNTEDEYELILSGSEFSVIPTEVKDDSWKRDHDVMMLLLEASPNSEHRPNNDNVFPFELAMKKDRFTLAGEILSRLNDPLNQGIAEYMHLDYDLDSEEDPGLLNVKLRRVLREIPEEQSTEGEIGCKGQTLLSLAILSQNEPLFKMLVNPKKENTSLSPYYGRFYTVTDKAKRLARDASSELFWKWGQDNLLHERYNLEEGRPPHTSTTCIVVFADDLKNSNEKNSSSSSRVKKKTSVALKIMVDEDAFNREANCLRKLQNTSKLQNSKRFVIPLFRTHTLQGNALRHFPQLSKFAQKPNVYVLVLKRAEFGDLSDVISHHNVAGEDLAKANVLAISIAKCLKHLNDDEKLMHGDVKARNFVQTDGIGNCSAIDLDAASPIDERTFAGRKNTSSGCVPPEQAAVLVRELTPSNGGGLDDQLEMVNSAMEEAMAKTPRNHELIAHLCQKANTLKAQSNPASTPVIAHQTYDMWCFGVLLYQLFTKISLFRYDSEENAESIDVLSEIAQWSDHNKREKLVKIQSRWHRRLVGQLLQKNPNDRPNTWNSVISELEGKPSGTHVTFVGILSTSTHGSLGINHSLTDEHHAILNLGIDFFASANCLRDIVKPLAKWDDVYAALRKVEGLENNNLVLHFGGHGNGTLTFADADGISVEPQGEASAKVLLGCKPECIVLNACNTYNFAQVILDQARASHCAPPFIVFWKTIVKTGVCVEFVKAFYRALPTYSDNSIVAYEDAYNHARLYLATEHRFVDPDVNQLGCSLDGSIDDPPFAVGTWHNDGVCVSIADAATLRGKTPWPMFTTAQNPPQPVVFTLVHWVKFVEDYKSNKTRLRFGMFFDCFGDEGPSREYWYQIDDTCAFSARSTDPFVVLHIHFLGTTANPDFGRIQSVNARWSIRANLQGRAEEIRRYCCAMGRSTPPSQYSLNLTGRHPQCFPPGRLAKNWVGAGSIANIRVRTWGVAKSPHNSNDDQHGYDWRIMISREQERRVVQEITNLVDSTLVDSQQSTLDRSQARTNPIELASNSNGYLVRVRLKLFPNLNRPPTWLARLKSEPMYHHHEIVDAYSATEFGWEYGKHDAPLPQFPTGLDIQPVNDVEALRTILQQAERQRKQLESSDKKFTYTGLAANKASAHLSITTNPTSLGQLELSQRECQHRSQPTSESKHL